MQFCIIMSCKKESKKGFSIWNERVASAAKKSREKHLQWLRAGRQIRNSEHLRRKRDGRRLMRQAPRMTLSSSNKVQTPPSGVLSYWRVSVAGTINMNVMAKRIYIQCS